MNKIRNTLRGFGAFSIVAASAIAIPLGTWQTDAGQAQAADRSNAAPVVVELFTSQSCYSCPPAEKLLGQLADNPGVLALEFHVDYWDDLVYGSAGRWKDVFSKPEYTERQRDYNARIRRTRSVYTPQMIVDGVDEMVGSHASKVRGAISQAQRRATPVSVSVQPDQAGGLSIRIDPKTNASGDADIWFVRFIDKQVTDVRAGENKGKTLANHHVVTEMRRLDSWDGGTRQIALGNPNLAAGEGCAILVQSDRPGPIVGAAACPDLGTGSQS